MVERELQPLEKVEPNILAQPFLKVVLLYFLKSRILAPPFPKVER
jgi:hypothetical protein